MGQTYRPIPWYQGLRFEISLPLIVHLYEGNLRVLRREEHQIPRWRFA